MMRFALFLIVCATLAASFVAITSYAQSVGAHVVLVYALPFALEPLALTAAWQHIVHKDASAGLIFWLSFLAAVAINMADAYPNVPLMMLHAVPPAAVVGAGEVWLRDTARRRDVRTILEARLEPKVTRDLEARLEPTVRAELEPKVRAQLERTTTRTVTTETTHERAQIEATGLDALKADTRPIVEAHLGAGGDVMQAELTERVMEELGLKRRAAQQRLAPIRAEVRT